MVKRKICVFTGTRAEYGLLRPLMSELKKDGSLDLQIVVSGMHLSREFGLTYKEIEKDGFRIDGKVDMSLTSDSSLGIARSISLGITGLSKAYSRLNPDIVVLLGDRFEAFAAATAAMVMRIPLAHLNGGEATYGVIDEAMRHSITKMSHLHFTSTETYKKRVIQLGEDPKRVFRVGATGMDNIRTMRLLSKKALEEELGFRFAGRNLLVTFHPVTIKPNVTKIQFRNLLNALDELENTRLIFTKANADSGGRAINKMIDKYVSAMAGKAVAFVSLGQLKYLSAMRLVDAVIGNSSSGIIEAPSFKIGTINIGDRQEGRLKAESVIDCDPDRADIARALKKLYSKDFQTKLKNIINPYGDGNAAKRIKKILKEFDLTDILKKRFHDLSPRSAK